MLNNRNLRRFDILLPNYTYILTDYITYIKSIFSIFAIFFDVYNISNNFPVYLVVFPVVEHSDS